MIKKYEFIYFLNKPPKTFKAGLLKMGVLTSFIAVLVVTMDLIIKAQGK